MENSIKDHIPYKLLKEGDQLLCRWLYAGNKTFTEPFFDETISICKQQAVNIKPFKCVSSLAILSDWSQKLDPVAPSAFIFHVSRCGSTLASQLLGISKQHIVLAEVPFFDELLYSKLPGYEINSLLKSAFSIYGQKRNGIEERLFIKTDSWHMFRYRQLRQLYPHIPFILLYRHPGEVIHSHRKRRGMQSVPGLLDPAVFGFKQHEYEGIGLDEYMAKVLEKYYACFIDMLHNDPLSIPVNYNQGGLEIVNTITTATKTVINEADKKAIQQRAGYNAKYPGEAFKEDQCNKEQSPYLIKALQLYNQVEEIRMVNRVAVI